MVFLSFQRKRKKAKGETGKRERETGRKRYAKRKNKIK